MPASYTLHVYILYTWDIDVESLKAEILIAQNYGKQLTDIQTYQTSTLQEMTKIVSLE